MNLKTDPNELGSVFKASYRKGPSITSGRTNAKLTSLVGIENKPCLENEPNAEKVL